MKPILTFVILVCSLILWPTSRPFPAEQKQSAKPAEWEKVTFKPETGKEVNVMVLRIWDSAAADPKWPQLALLRLPPPVYIQLWKDPKALKAFIDGTQTGKLIFDATVTITDGCKLPEPKDEKSAEEVSWLVILSHRTSHVSCSALPEHAI
jgi:hypothetical protein